MDPNEKNNNVIQFYGAKQENGYLSNFYPSPFQVGDYVYKTNEHYFQSKKFEGHEEEKLVIEAEKPGQAFKLGRNSKFPKRKEWQEVKDEVMYQGLKQKFKTHKDLTKKLLQTGDKQLVEHTVKDKYWGDGGNGTGLNRLGELLMRLRSQLRKPEKEKSLEKEKSSKG